MSSSVAKQNILIIGGGGAGVLTAQTLSKSLDPSRFTLQLVTERPFNIFYPAMLRAVVTPTGAIEKLALNPYDKVFAPGKAGEVIIGKVTSVEDGLAHLEDGQQLRYDYLVLATGTIWNGPLSFPTDLEKTEKWINDWREKFRKAQNVVIIGGGAVGFELAGELRHFYPNKTVTIVHSQAYVLNDRYPEKFRKYALKKARALGINVILGDRLSLPEGPYTSVTTEKGVKIEADLVVPAAGGKPNTEFLRSFDPTILTSSGTVRVQPTFQVPLANGKTNVWALGDIIDWNEEKQLAKVPSHAAVVSANVLGAIDNKATKPKEYGGFMEAIAMPLGPKGGVGYIPLLWGIILGDFFTWLLKSRTLFVQNAKKSVTYA